MILVDTSVLVDYFRGNENPPVLLFGQVLDRFIPFGICNFVYQELLQGARSHAELEKLDAYLETLRFFELRYGRESFRDAATLNLVCRSRGVTVRSTIDLLIAQIAIENDLYLLHNDSDFDNIRSVLPVLKTYRPAG